MLFTILKHRIRNQRRLKSFVGRPTLSLGLSTNNQARPWLKYKVLTNIRGLSDLQWHAITYFGPVCKCRRRYPTLQVSDYTSTCATKMISKLLHQAIMHHAVGTSDPRLVYEYEPINSTANPSTAGRPS